MQGLLARMANPATPVQSGFATCVLPLSTVLTIFETGLLPFLFACDLTPSLNAPLTMKLTTIICQHVNRASYTSKLCPLIFPVPIPELILEAHQTLTLLQLATGAEHTHHMSHDRIWDAAAACCVPAGVGCAFPWSDCC